MNEVRHYFLIFVFFIAGTTLAAYSLYIMYETMNWFFLILSLMSGGFLGLCLGAGIDVFYHDRKNIKP